MKEIVDYKILTETFENCFQEMVTAHLEEKWDLLGAPFSHNGKLCQCVVRVEEQEPMGPRIDALQKGK